MSRLLQETGDGLLLETGDAILIDDLTFLVCVGTAVGDSTASGVAALVRTTVGTAAGDSAMFGDGVRMGVGGVRPPYLDVTPSILLRGAPCRARADGCTIRDILNNVPNTCNITIDSPAPVVGDKLRITVGTRLLFAGQIQTVDLSYEGLEPDGDARPVYRCAAIDDTPRFSRRRPFGSFDNEYIFTIAELLRESYAPGFVYDIVDDLAAARATLALDGSKTLGEVFASLAQLAGGYFKIEDNHIYLFLVLDPRVHPDDITDRYPGRFEDDPPISLTYDNSQQRTRVSGSGSGSTALVPVNFNESVIPVATAATFTPGGGLAITGSQRFRYSAIDLGHGTTTTLDPGDSVVIGPIGIIDAGIDGNMLPGEYRYAVAFASAQGRTVHGAVSFQIQFGPSTFGTGTYVSDFDSGAVMAPGLHVYKNTIVTAHGESGAQGHTTANVVAPSQNSVDITNNLYTDPRIVAIRHYRDDILVATLTASGQTFQDLGPPGAAVGPPLPNEDWARGQFHLFGIPVSGDPSITTVIIYRSERNGAALFELASIPNGTTTYTDNATDDALGDPAPTVGSLGWPPGTTALGLKNPSNVGTSGWIRVGSQIIKYPVTPTSGVGSIQSEIPRGALVENVPALRGVGGMLGGPMDDSVPNGAAINIFVQRDDLAAQAEQAARDVLNGISPADGIIDGPPIVAPDDDEATLTAALDAELALYARPLATVKFASRDIRTTSGQTVHIDVREPPIGPIDLTIQDVTIDQIDAAPELGLPPRFTVTASSVRFSLEDMIRQLLARLGRR